MERSELFVPTTKETQSEASVVSADLSLRSGLVHQYGSGVFSFTVTGKTVLEKLTDRIRAEMDAIGAQEVDLPSLQSSEIWRRSGRWENFEDEMFTLVNREGKDMCLAPTHEETIAAMVRGSLRSHRDLPLALYQVGRKYRDDHARNGLLRTKEFTMKDAYSFHATEESLDETYRAMYDAYVRIFDALGVDFAVVDADPGAMGGSASEEFQAPADIGSDEIRYCPEAECVFGSKDDAATTCPDCGTDLVHSNAIELGHIFKLGTRYSEPLELHYDDPDEETREIIMGSYGIGVSRLIPTLIEQNHDAHGIVWPEEVAPFRYAVIPVAYEGELGAVADDVYESLPAEETLLYDTDVTTGEKFAESDLIGIPKKIIVGRSYEEDGRIEVKHRTGEQEFYDADEFGPGVLAD